MLKDLNLVGGMTNTDWLNQFHDEMRTHKITQGQLAKTADYSRSHLNQLLTGNKPINQQARLRLTLAMRSLEETLETPVPTATFWSAEVQESSCTS